MHNVIVYELWMSDALKQDKALNDECCMSEGSNACLDTLSNIWRIHQYISE